MTAYFFDSSALVKRYLDEKGSAWVRQIFQGSPQHTVYICELTLVEIASAVARRVRAKSLPQDYWRAFRPLLMSHLTQYEIVPFSRSYVENTMGLCFKPGLRAYDAIQLATAILIRNNLPLRGAQPLTFVSSDADLIAAAAMPEFDLRPYNPELVSP